MAVEMDQTTKDEFVQLLSYGQIDGDHHKAWVIDQIARLFFGDGYEEFVREMKDGEDGPDTYGWNLGIPP